MRIAVLSYGLPVPGQKRGGIERVAHELAEGLYHRGHDVIVWSYDPAPPGAPYRVRMLPAKRFVTSWLGRRLTMGYLGNVLFLLPHYGRCDVFMSHGDSLLLPLLRRPLVRVVHGSALGEALSASSPWRFLLQLGIYGQELLSGLLQPGCVAVSDNTRRHNPFVHRTIPTGVDCQEFFPDGSPRSEQPSILFVGAWTGRKRGARLAEWFEQHVRPRYPEATLEIVGPPGPPRPGVTYRTGVTDAELVKLYRRAWVYASPSRYEGFGLPYLEAMACGTPVLATPNPGSREVLADGQYGVLAADADFPGELLALLGDADRRAELTRRGLERAVALSLDATLDQYESLLHRVIDRHAGHRQREV